MRRLALYSDQIIPENRAVDRELLRLLGGGRARIGYIPSAGDPERRWFRSRRAYYARCGLDLALFFALDDEHDPAQLGALLACDAIHLAGGKTYQFLADLRRRGMVEPLRRYADGGGVLIGTSAGAIVTTPTIATAALCGDRPDPDLADLSGLGLTSFAFLPHSGQIPDREAAIQLFLQQHKLPLVVCPDGGGAVVEGDELRLIGGAQIYQPRGYEW